MTVHVARNKANAIACITSGVSAIVDLDYENGWEDAFALGRLGQKYGVAVQFRTIEHVAARSPEALLRGLRAPKGTFRQRYLYCMFDLSLMTDALLAELEARAVEHGDYILPGHLLEDATLIWD
ncbi:PHA-granule associated protein 4 [Cupriavidus sp. TMH.W2]|uniref:PHA-granule associated protein 4 n=1 Tax=Cupriavidus sp. TMH.W2 TaxID=3434465 RepID=UPI003D774B49